MPWWSSLFDRNFIGLLWDRLPRSECLTRTTNLHRHEHSNSVGTTSTTRTYHSIDTWTSSWVQNHVVCMCALPLIDFVWVVSGFQNFGMPFDFFKFIICPYNISRMPSRLWKSLVNPHVFGISVMRSHFAFVFLHSFLLRIKLKCGLVCELTLRVNRHSKGQESPLSHHYAF